MNIETFSSIKSSHLPEEGEAETFAASDAEGHGAAAAATNHSSTPTSTSSSLKGILSFIANHSVRQYEYDATVWKAGTASRRKLRKQNHHRRRPVKDQDISTQAMTCRSRRRRVSEIIGGAVATNTSSNTRSKEDDPVRVVIALLDLNEPYSIRLLETLVAICHYQPSLESAPDDGNDSCRFHLFIATQNHGESDDTNVVDTLSWEDEILMGSGSCKLVLEKNKSLGWWYALMGFGSCPAVAVVDGQTGRKCTDAHEELAVLWNQDDIPGIRHRWIQKQSAFANQYQKLQAQILFPTTCQIV